MVDVAKKRRIPEFICMSRQIDDVTLVYQIKKPFDVLTEGLLVSLSRGDRTSIELFLAGLAGWNAALRRYFPGENGSK